MSGASFKDEIKERNSALASFDMGWARKQMPSASNDFVRELAMHKARYECTALDSWRRLESAEFLRLHGSKRMTGDDLLPIGELPK